MKIQLRNRYIENLYACLHTLSGNCEFCNSNASSNEIIVTEHNLKKRPTKDSDQHHLILNPNRVCPSTMIKKYSEFEYVLQESLGRMEVENFQITRADLSFNSDDFRDYELFKKLNRLLICCIASSRNIKNCYRTTDLWTHKSLSIAVKSELLEAENYDKSMENPNVETKNRLELRSKKMKNTTLRAEFTEKWVKRLDQAFEHFERVQERYNHHLNKLWIDDQAKKRKDRDYASLTAFLLQFKDCIFTRKQLVNLIAMTGANNPETIVKNFKNRHNIELYSKQDLKIIIEAIKEKMFDYFNS